MYDHSLYYRLSVARRSRLIEERDRQRIFRLPPRRSGRTTDRR